MVCLFRFLLDKSRRREVTVAVIRQEGYDGLASVFRTFCDFRSGIESCTAGDTDEEAFGFGEFLSRFISLFCRDCEDFVVDLGIQCFRNEVCADALEFVRACMAFREERRTSSERSTSSTSSTDSPRLRWDSLTTSACSRMN